MKKSIKSLLEEFSDQPDDIQKLLKEIFLFEQDKMHLNNILYKAEYKSIIDALVDENFTD